MAKRKPLTQKFYDAVGSCHDLARTFRLNEESRTYAAGFHAGVSAVVGKFKGLFGDLEAFERTDAVRMASESEIMDTLQWNLRQQRTLVSILRCEGESDFVASAVLAALEEVLRGEKSEEVHV